MVRAWAVTILLTGCFGLVAAVCLRTGLRNLAEFRRNLRRAPLEETEILGARLGDTTVPRPWPEPATLSHERVAAAYRDYARERRESMVLAGELLLVTGGAALGASAESVLRGGFNAWPAAAALGASTVGVLVKRHGEQRWSHVARLYERRRSELTRTPVRSEPPRAGWLRRLVGR